MSGRIRTIKPEWLEDELLALASDAARVLSIALILLADDYGNGRANLLMMAGQVFPGKPLDHLANALEELRTKAKFVLLYEVDGQQYFTIRNWAKHQRVDKPGKPKVPKPPKNIAQDKDSGDSPERPENAPEQAASVPVNLAPDLEGNGREGSGSGSARDAAHGEAPPPKIDRFLRSLTPPHPDELWIFEQWAKIFGKANVVFDANRAVCLAERRLCGMTREDAAAALRGALRDPFVNGQKDGKKHDRLSFIFGDQERFEEFRDAGQGKAIDKGAQERSAARKKQIADDQARDVTAATERAEEILRARGIDPAKVQGPDDGAAALRELTKGIGG